MKSKKRLLENSRLYAIIDKKTCRKKSILDIANKIRNQCIDIVQYRDKESDKKALFKNAQDLQRILSDTKIIFIVNDYLDIAKIINSDGLHLGQNDTSIEIARKILGKDKVIGISCHNLKQAIVAQKRGADYISIGPIFSTPIKPEYKSVGLKLIKQIKGKVKIPVFAIGAINETNLKEVLSYGAKRVGVLRAICQSRNIPLTITRFDALLHQQ
jgi:thiamine-phosphate pyrophosphorylase